MKFFQIFTVVVSFIIFSCNGQTSKNSKTIDAKTFAEKIKTTENPQILDVRTPEEFESEHIENAKNINWLGDSFMKDAKNLDKTKPVFIYCKSGGRSSKATQKLEELGFTSIYELDGGYLKWEAAGLSKPSEKIIGLNLKQYNELLNSDKKVLIDFYAEWCAPCKKMTPYLSKMQKEWSDKVVIIRLNADKNKTLMREMKIDVLPTLILYENKEIKWKHSGYISEEELKKQL